MKARDIMHKRVISVRPETTLDELARLLTENGVSGVPVIGPEGDLIGLVSQTDLVRQPHEGDTAAAVMTPWTVSLEEDADIKDVARQMLSKQIHRLVITREGRMCGIITSLDLVRALLKQVETK
ncbi:MAG: CBS domain-containing protein [Elusimicrobia bacterium]|nr:CBS domain-containing protein [Elusimicrobiota bacterium]